MVVGYKLELTAPPVQHKVKAPLRFSLTESKKIEAEIPELLQKGALTNVTPDSDQFVSNLFLVPKRDGGSRLVINLKDLNEYLQYNHFKMEGIHLLRDLMRPNDWLGKIDLKDAYFVVPIWENHKKYLRFLWKNSLLEFACLPFGLAIAPRVFTKIMKPVVALLRRTGIRLIIYLDDLFMYSSKVGLQQDMTTAQYLLENLGFVINLEKSCFQPTQQLEFLGFVVNTLDMTLLLPDCKVEAIKSHCSKMLLYHEVSVRELSQLIGKLTASIQAIFPAPLHYRHLQDLKHKALARFGHFDATTALSTEAKDELQWWLAHLNAWNGRALVRPSPDVIIETDASRTGWGGGSLPGRNHGGLMVPNGEKIPYQLLGTSSGLLCCQELYKESPLCSCAVAHGQCLSGSLYQPPRGYSFLDSLQFSTSPLGMGSETQHISQCRTSIGGSECVSGLGVAPFRRLERLEALSAIFRSLMQVRGPCALYLFANRLNAQLTQFYSWRPDPMALATDALLQNWPVGRLYAFPPFCLIMRCLAKLREEGGELILVTLVWPTQAWYPSLLELSVSLPILLPWGPKLLQGPQGQSHLLVMNQTLQLAAWHVCNDLCSQRAFLATLPSSSWQLGGQVQTQFIIPPGKNGIAGVSQGKLIHFAPLWQI